VVAAELTEAVAWKWYGQVVSVAAEEKQEGLSSGQAKEDRVVESPEDTQQPVRRDQAEDALALAHTEEALALDQQKAAVQQVKVLALAEVAEGNMEIAVGTH